ncbi:hypothetical protein HG530_001733 [Fusarium avenaceum]|nr:hypothetical protein HG530_001733 [Fusarium avenaceum]
MPLGVLVGEEHDDVYLITLIRRKRIHKASNRVREERRRGTIDARYSNAEKLVLYLHFCSLLVFMGVDFALEVFVDLGFADGGESAIEGDTALVEEGRRVIVAIPGGPAYVAVASTPLYRKTRLVVIGGCPGSPIQPAKPYEVIGDLNTWYEMGWDLVLSYAWRLRVYAESQVKLAECDEQFVQVSDYRSSAFVLLGGVQWFSRTQIVRGDSGELHCAKVHDEE